MRPSNDRRRVVKVRPVFRWVLALAVTAGFLGTMAKISAAPVRLNRAGSSQLRLSWSARPERIEQCRRLSEEELEEVEEHMRQRVQCEGRFATYALRVYVDGDLAHRSVVHGAGLRNDRPIYLLRDLDVAPGTHRLRVSFERRENADEPEGKTAGGESTSRDSGLFAGREERENVERARRKRAAIPAKLVLQRTISFKEGQVIVVTFDPEKESLRVLNR